MTDERWSPKVARVLHEYHDAAPMAPTADQLAALQPPAAPSHRGATIVAVILVLAGIVGVAAVVGRNASGPSGGGTIRVHHRQYRITVEGQTECATPIANDNTFDSVTLDTWSDRTGRQWLHRLTYPDGSTYDLLKRGSALYPTELYERGTHHEYAIGCEGPAGERMVLGQIPDPFDPVTLRTELAADELPYIRTYDQIGQLVDGQAKDGAGRLSQLWEWRIAGTAGFGDTADLATNDVTSWWVAADGVTINERRFEHTIETLGQATQTDTLVVDEDVDVAADLFDAQGARALETSPRPAPPGSVPSGDTLTGDTSVATTGAAPTTSTESTTPDGTTPSGAECAGADLDLTEEPPLWRQGTNTTWYRNGCVVRVDVISDVKGPAHCGWDSARLITVGSPVGTPFTNPNDDVQYVRDPANAFGEGLAAGYDPNGTLPPGAVDTGYSSQTEALWAVPGDDRFIYLVLDGRTERWPKADPPVCS